MYILEYTYNHTPKAEESHGACPNINSHLRYNGDMGIRNDLVAATSLTLSGCQLVLFTTGRGTPFGTFVPTMKISTNSQLAAKKHNWIDFNAGTIVEDTPAAEVCEQLFEKVVAVCNGERLHHENEGAKEIAIFKTGVTL